MKIISNKKLLIFKHTYLSKQKSWFLFCSIFIYKLFTFLIIRLLNTVRAYFIIIRSVPLHLLRSGRIRSYIHKITFFVSPIFEIIFNNRIKLYQIKNLLIAGIATPIFDDFFDTENKYSEFTNAQVINKIYEMKQNQKDFHFLLQFIINHIKFKIDFNTQYNKVVKIQSLCEQQRESISIQEIINLSEAKGGESLILYAICADFLPSEIEKTILKQLGYFFQLIDDIYDVTSDKIKNIHTIPTYYTTKPLLLKLHLFRQVTNIISQADIIQFNKKKDFIDYIDLLTFFASLQLSRNELNSIKLGFLKHLRYFCYALNFTYRTKAICLTFKN